MAVSHVRKSEHKHFRSQVTVLGLDYSALEVHR